MTSQLFALFAYGSLQSICETAEAALAEEAFLIREYGEAEAGSVVGEDLEACWEMMNFILGPVLVEPAEESSDEQVYTEGGLHCHQCPSCQTVWQHPDNCTELEHGEFLKAHQCPACGTEERWKLNLALDLPIDFPWSGGNC